MDYENKELMENSLDFEQPGDIYNSRVEMPEVIEEEECECGENAEEGCYCEEEVKDLISDFDKTKSDLEPEVPESSSQRTYFGGNRGRFVAVNGGAYGQQLIGDFGIPSGEIHSSLVITSDPQYPWYRGQSSGMESKSREVITDQYKSINEYARNNKLSTSVTVNGDLTAFGHNSELSVFNSLVSILEPPVFLGLGNHDIENNYRDCYAFGTWNACQRRMLDYIKSHVNNHSFIDKFDSRSYAYSYDLGSVYCIQMQNYPTMNSSYTSLSGDDYIRPNLSLMDQWMTAAKDKGKSIILHIHKPDSWSPRENSFGSPYEPSQAFINMIKKHNVDAVFCGHYHSSDGEFTTSFSSYFGGIPVFLSGAADYHSYLIAEFGDEKMNVYRVSNNAWRSKALIKTINLNVNHRQKWNGTMVEITPLNAAGKLLQNNGNNDLTFENHDRVKKNQAYIMSTTFRTSDGQSFCRFYDTNKSQVLTCLSRLYMATPNGYSQEYWQFDDKKEQSDILNYMKSLGCITIGSNNTTATTETRNYSNNQILYITQRMRLFQDHDALGTDHYFTSNFSSWNDTISSILLPARSRITLYEDLNYAGKTLDITNPSTFPRFVNLRGQFNDVVSCYKFWQYYNYIG